MKEIGIGVTAGIIGGIAGGVMAAKMSNGGFEIDPRKLKKKFEKAGDDVVEEASDAVEDVAEAAKEVMGGAEDE